MNIYSDSDFAGFAGGSASLFEHIIILIWKTSFSESEIY